MSLVELVIDLLLDASDYTDSINDEVNKAEGYGKAFGDNFILGATALVTGLTAILGMLTGVGIAAFDFSNQFQTANVRMQSELGLTAEEAQDLGDVVLDVFGNNFFDSIEDATDAVTFVRQTVGDLANDELQSITEKSAAIADSFDEDFSKVASSAKSLVDNGLVDNFDEAFDMITKGFQSGLNRSEDFLDSIEEYSVQFGNGGGSAEEFFSVLQTGLQGGVLGTDKAADMFKEFSLRIFEGSDNVAASLAAMGLEDLPAHLESGAITTVQAFDMVVQGMGGVGSEADALAIGTALLGTQFEDLGTAALEGLTTTSTAFDNVAGAADSLNVRYETLGDVLEGVKRQALIALKPLGDALLEVANLILPLVLSAFDQMKPFIENAMNTAVAFITNVVAAYNDSGLAGVLEYILSTFGLTSAQIQVVFEKVEQFKQGLIDIITPIIDVITNFVSWKDVLIAGGLAVGAVVIPILISIVTSLLSILAPIAAVIAAVALFRKGWETDFLGMKTFLLNVWNNFILPTFEKLKGFVLETLIPTIAHLWQQWTTVWFPQIVTSLQNAWLFIEPILTKLWTWFTENLIPTVLHLWEQWTTVWFPEIQTALQNAWVIIEEILSELDRWFNENIIPIVEYFYDKWTNEWLPAIQQKLEDIWLIIEPILTTFYEWFAILIEPAVTGARDAMNSAWQSIGDTLSNIWNNHIKPIFDAIRDFWNWLTSADFSFNISIPDLPEWMKPGSPIPLHTRWKDFHSFLKGVTFEPKFRVPEKAYDTVLSGIKALDGIQSSTQVDSSNNRYVFPNVTNENAVLASIAAIKGVRRSRSIAWADR